MIPVYQTKFHSQTTKGNCLAACIASLLELDIEKVPHFEDMDEEWLEELINFLDSCGKLLLILYNEEDFKEHFSIDKLEDLYYIAVGKSPRDLSIRHSVIFKNGNLAHDPHYSGDSILTEEAFWAFKDKETR